MTVLSLEQDLLRGADGGVDGLKRTDRELERMREQLYRMISRAGFRFSSDETLWISGKMDELILQYYRERDTGCQKRSFFGSRRR